MNFNAKTFYLAYWDVSVRITTGFCNNFVATYFVMIGISMRHDFDIVA